MKNIFIGFAIATILAACNTGNNPTADTTKKDTTINTPQAITDTAGTKSVTVPTNEAFPAKQIIASYLELKNALTKDNAKDAAAAGNSMVAGLAKVDMKNLSKDQMKSYMDVADDLKENAEHIGANAGKIDHQREHFEMLSKDMADLVKTFGNGGQTLYKDFCPMANKGKGAIWISEVKEIKNPYLGTRMPGCGSVKETIK